MLMFQVLGIHDSRFNVDFFDVFAVVGLDLLVFGVSALRFPPIFVVFVLSISALCCFVSGVSELEFLV